MDYYTLPDGTRIAARRALGEVVIQAVDADPLRGLTLRRQPVQVTQNGQTVLVQGQTGKRLRVVQLLLVSAQDTDITLASGAQALTGPLPLRRAPGFVLPFSPAGWLETEAGQPLILLQAVAVGIGGVVGYVEDE